MHVCVCSCNTQMKCLGLSSEPLPLSSLPCDMRSPGISHRHYNHKHTSARRGEPEREHECVRKREAEREREGQGGRGSCQSRHTDSRSTRFCLFVFVCFCLPRILAEVMTTTGTPRHPVLFQVIWILLCSVAPYIYSQVNRQS